MQAAQSGFADQEADYHQNGAMAVDNQRNAAATVGASPTFEAREKEALLRYLSKARADFNSSSI